MSLQNELSREGLIEMIHDHLDKKHLASLAAAFVEIRGGLGSKAYSDALLRLGFKKEDFTRLLNAANEVARLLVKYSDAADYSRLGLDMKAIGMSEHLSDLRIDNGGDNV